MQSQRPEDYGFLPSHTENILIYNPTPDTVIVRFDSVPYPFFPNKIVKVSQGVGGHARDKYREHGLVEVRTPREEHGETMESVLEDAHAAGLNAWLENRDELAGHAQSVLEDCEGSVPKVVPMPIHKRSLEELKKLLKEAQEYAAKHPTPIKVEEPKGSKKGEKGDRQYA
jgi:hypothetical protein